MKLILSIACCCNGQSLSTNIKHRIIFLELTHDWCTQDNPAKTAQPHYTQWCYMLSGGSTFPHLVTVNISTELEMTYDAQQNGG